MAKQIVLSTGDIAAIQNALDAAQFLNPQHRNTLQMFHQRVRDGKALTQPNKEEV